MQTVLGDLVEIHYINALNHVIIMPWAITEKQRFIMAMF